MQHQPSPLTLITSTRNVSGSAWHALSQRLQTSVGTSVHRWAVDSQRSACRNAMVAGTALAQRRAEREEVEEFLAARVPAPATERDHLPAPDQKGHPAHTAHG